MSMKVLFLIGIIGFASGCQILRPAANAGLTIGEIAAPQYAEVIREIKSRIDRKQVNPVEGFEFKILYRYRGSIVDPSDITWEEIFVREGSAAKGLPPVGPAVSEVSEEDARLSAEIKAILDAAGIGE
jgi:hypothetical protein